MAKSTIKKAAIVTSSSSAVALVPSDPSASTALRLPPSSVLLSKLSDIVTSELVADIQSRIAAEPSIFEPTDEQRSMTVKLEALYQRLYEAQDKKFTGPYARLPQETLRSAFCLMNWAPREDVEKYGVGLFATGNRSWTCKHAQAAGFDALKVIARP